MKVYIGSFFDTRARLRPVKDSLWKMGYEVVSTWLDEISKPSYLERGDFWRKLARKDLAEVHSANIVILDTLDETPRGGREVEYGYALAGHQTKLILVVGPVRNVFHTLADRQFQDWDACLAFLRQLMDDPAEPNTTP